MTSNQEVPTWFSTEGELDLSYARDMAGVLIQAECRRIFGYCEIRNIQVDNYGYWHCEVRVVKKKGHKRNELIN